MTEPIKPLVDVVKITRRIGEDEILEVSFNGIGEETLEKTRQWLDFLIARMNDHNAKVIALADTLGGAKPGLERVK